MLLLLLRQARLTMVHVRVGATAAHATVIVINSHNCALLVDCLLELGVSLLLDGLRVLQLLDELHLEHFHLHDFLLLLLDERLLLGDLASYLFSSRVNFLFTELFHLGTLDALLLLHCSVLEFFLTHLQSQMLLVLNLLLFFDKLGLLGFLFFV